MPPLEQGAVGQHSACHRGGADPLYRLHYRKSHDFHDARHRQPLPRVCLPAADGSECARHPAVGHCRSRARAGRYERAYRRGCAVAHCARGQWRCALSAQRSGAGRADHAHRARRHPYHPERGGGKHSKTCGTLRRYAVLRYAVRLLQKPARLGQRCGAFLVQPAAVCRSRSAHAGAAYHCSCQ